MSLGENIRDSSKRRYQSTYVIGGKNQGKSTYLRDQADSYLHNLPDRRVFIHDVSQSKAFADLPIVSLEMIERGTWKWGAARNTSLDYQAVHEVLSTFYMNGMVVFDEFSTYVKANPPAWQRYLITNHRNKGIDVAYVLHRYKSASVYFGALIDNVVCFKTKETGLKLEDFEKRFGDPKAVFEAYHQIIAAKPTNSWTQPHLMVKL